MDKSHNKFSQDQIDELVNLLSLNLKNQLFIVVEE